MFIVVAHSDEYIRAKQEGDAAWDFAPQYRCCGIFETEAEARASFHYDERDDLEHYDPVKWRDVAYLFIAGDAAAGGRFVLYAGDNGWELASAGVAVGFFATADEALSWGLAHGFGDEQVIELDTAHAEQAAA
jgi:hypothetical protein